ncbi:MAG TPA: hypothetical protein PK542_01250 [Treponemataceae bacterium]|nr:hypothetical protein [Treponemataceae bacterium]
MPAYAPVVEISPFEERTRLRASSFCAALSDAAFAIPAVFRMSLIGQVLLRPEAAITALTSISNETLPTPLSGSTPVSAMSAAFASATYAAARGTNDAVVLRYPLFSW